jgi:hypothetical protein
MSLPGRQLLLLLVALAAAGACAPEDDAGDEGSGAAQLDANVAVTGPDLGVGAPDGGAGSTFDATSASSSATGGREAGSVVLADASAAGDARSRQDAGRPVATLSDASSADAAARDAGGALPGDAACPAHGSVSYMLQQKSAPSSAETMAYARIRMAMDTAVEKYNCYTNLSRQVNVTYDPNVQTADGSTGGTIRFGSEASMHFVTAMHELGHVFGVGSTQFKPLVQNGVFTGQTATAEMRRISSDPMATVKSDGTHFWPYGLNYVSEYKSEADLISHCAIVVAIRKDLGM